MPLSVGTMVAGYRIEGVLGAGGMGTVYRAAHPTLPRSDALKVLSAELSQDDQFRARFVREAELAATLDHPNIVTVYNRGETEHGQLWIAMQYVPGSDADKELREGRMTPERCVHIVTEVGKALDYAHRRKLLHRDIKPANFLISPEDERVFLADFGIARALDDAVGLTQTGMVMASVAYAAPESLSGEDVDGRADIYSLTCSLYRMLTSKTPYAGTAGGMAGMAAAHVTQPAPRVTDRVPTLPRAIDDVIAIGMAKDPRDRFQTARELGLAAAEALDDTTAEVRRSPVRQPPPGPPPRTGPTPAGGAPYTNQRVPPPGPPGRDTGTHPGNWYNGPNGPQPHTAPAPYSSGPPPQQFSAAPVRPSAAKKTNRRKLLIGGALVAVIALVAVLAGVFMNTESEPEYQAKSVSHAHGTTDIKAAPKAVAALGPGDADAVLALGVQPVALTAAGGKLPSWEQQSVTGSPAVLGFLDTSAVAAAKPDLIISTGEIDDATYNKLAAIAPTVTRPSDATAAWTWQEQLKWVGNILGKDAKANEISNAVRTQQDDLRNQNPAFNGKTVEVAWVSDDGVGQVLTPSNAASYLEGLGFRYNQELERAADDVGSIRPVPNLTTVSGIETDVLVVVRTDKAAGQGGFAGLPSEFNSYRGDMVIADDPDVVAALAEPGGYLATQFLDANFVAALARQVT